MISISINLYHFEELPETAKERAIMDHRGFLLSVLSPEDFISGDPAYDTPEKLEEAYRDEYDYYIENDEPIIDSIEANDYLFCYNGDYCRSCTYTAGPHKGKTLVTIHGETFEYQEENTNA